MFESCTGGNETAHDDVFLQAAEIVHLTGHGSFGEDAGGLLEAGRGDERVGRKRGLGDAKQERTARCRTAALLDDIVIFLAEPELIDLLLEKERGVADVFDL